MESQNLKQLREILWELKHKGNEKLSQRQIELITQAQGVLEDTDSELKKNKPDWKAYAPLAMQAIKLVMELLSSG